jgi:hypothetical protein
MFYKYRISGKIDSSEQETDKEIHLWIATKPNTQRQEGQKMFFSSFHNSLALASVIFSSVLSMFCDRTI